MPKVFEEGKLNFVGVRDSFLMTVNDIEGSGN